MGGLLLEIAPAVWINPAFVVSVREIAPGSWRLTTYDGQTHQVTDPALVDMLSHGRGLGV